MSVIGQLNALYKHFQIHTELIWDIQSMITHIPTEGSAFFFSEICKSVPLNSAVIETEVNRQQLSRHSQIIPMCINSLFHQCH